MLQDSNTILRNIFTAILVVVCFFRGFSQHKWIDEKAAPLSSIDQIILPELDNQSLKEKYKVAEGSERGTPHIFAETIYKNIDVTDNGRWESSANGYLLWRQRISSKRAYSLNLGFTDFFLPSSAALFIYDVQKTFVVGPITQSDNDVHKEWWSPVIPSDDIILELQIEPKDLKDLRLNLTRINHDFSGLGAVLSGSCNLDVTCGASDGFEIVERFRDVINSVGMIMIQGRIQCTGSLLNNTRKDCTPYVITAEHCGINESTAASVLVYWNFQNSQCRPPNSLESGNPGDGEQNQFNSGSTLVAKYDQSDFTLVELDDPVNPNVNPFFAGWDNESEDVDTAFVIHHPAGGEKRISFDFDTLSFNVDIHFVQVADWDIGTTESGSSGSGLFNTSSRLIGHLSGGDAACGNDEFDDFGMFKKSWEGGGTPETRLKDWLDPLNTGQTVLDGRYCIDIAVISQNSVSICASTNPRDTLTLTATAGYESGGTLRVLNAPEGINVTFSSEVISTGQEVDIFLEVTDQFIGNDGSISFIVENDEGPAEYVIDLHLFIELPGVPALISPADQVNGLDFEVSFEWGNTAPEYTLEISEFPNFMGTPRVFSGLEENKITLKDFEATTTYFWRIKAINSCGESVYTDTFSFTTGSIICQSSAAKDLPQTIGEDPITINSSIFVTSKGTVSDVNILGLAGRHTFISDLTISLTSPSGTTVVLVQTPCSDEENFLVSFDDDSDLINLDCPLTTGRSFKPVEALAGFIGEIAAGEWILTVEDGVSLDGGSVDAWTLELCVNQTDTKRFETQPAFVELCDKVLSPIDISISLNGDWINPANPLVTTGSGMALAANISPDPIGSATTVNIQIEAPAPLIGSSSIVITFVDEQETLTANIPVVHISNVSSPELMIPENNAEKQDLLPTFGWISGILEEGTHLFRLSTSEDMTVLVLEEDVIDDSLAISIELEELTTYYWQVTAIGMCSDSSSSINSFTTDKKVATIDESLAGVSIYPNPALEYLSIDLNDIVNRPSLQFELITVQGKILFQGRLNQEVTTLDVSLFPVGLYFVNIISESGSYIQKVIIQK